MNRRTFIVAGAAALAFSSQRVFGQMMEQLSGITAVSELTGAELDLGRNGLSFYGRLLDNRNDTETLGFNTDTCDGAVRFIPAGTDTESYLDDRAQGIAEQMDASDVVGMDAFDDGGWMAMSVQTSSGESRGIYLEIQLDAFPGYDLEVFLAADEETFEDDFDLMQQAQLEGLELFLFTQESGMPAMIFSAAASSGSTRSNRGSGSTQSQTSGSSTRESTTSNSGNSNRTGSVESDPDNAIETVRRHQAQFMDELDSFYEIVELIGSEDSAAIDEANWFDDLLDLMFSWSAYPDTAAKVAFPSDLASLESTYIEWSDGVGEMGLSMSAWMLGEGEIDAFLDAIDVAVQLNSVLSAELRTLGIVIKPVGQGFVRPINFPRRSLNTYVSMHKVA